MNEQPPQHLETKNSENTKSGLKTLINNAMKARKEYVQLKRGSKEYIADNKIQTTVENLADVPNEERIKEGERLKQKNSKLYEYIFKNQSTWEEESKKSIPEGSIQPKIPLKVENLANKFLDDLEKYYNLQYSEEQRMALPKIFKMMYMSMYDPRKTSFYYPQIVSQDKVKLGLLSKLMTSKKFFSFSYGPEHAQVFKMYAMMTTLHQTLSSKKQLNVELREFPENKEQQNKFAEKYEYQISDHKIPWLKNRLIEHAKNHPNEVYKFTVYDDSYKYYDEIKNHISTLNGKFEFNFIFPSFSRTGQEWKARDVYTEKKAELENKGIVVADTLESIPNEVIEGAELMLDFDGALGNNHTGRYAQASIQKQFISDVAIPVLLSNDPSQKEVPDFTESFKAPRQ